MLPGTVDQLIAPGRALPGQHRRSGAPAGPGVLQLREVDGLAVLEDVELAADQVGGNAIGDDALDDVLRIAGLPVGTVVGLSPPARMLAV